MFTLTLAVGLVVVVAVSLSPLYLGRARLPLRSAAAGSALVAAALVLAVPSALWRVAVLPSRNAEFLLAFVLLLAGALLIVAAPGDGGAGGEGDEPQWWPSFELDFRSYAARPRPAGPARSRR